jgi:cytochrome P450
MDLGRVQVRAGDHVGVLIGAANRDPAQFESPDRLDVGRKPNLHVAFGHGGHACAGMNVARLEARVAIGALARRFARIELSGVPRRDRRVRFRGLVSLPVRL